MAKGDDIQERLIDFAVDIIELTSRLPKTPAGRHVASQLVRSGTAPAPNYAEARGAESYNDFVHKLKVALKELHESKVWLLIIKRSKMLIEDEVRGPLHECDELCKIIGASVKTVLKRRTGWGN
jgi:four helix bundle protein